MAVRYTKTLVLEPEVAEDVRNDTFQAKTIPRILSGCVKEALWQFVYGERVVLHIIATNEDVGIEECHSLIHEVLKAHPKEE